MYPRYSRDTVEIQPRYSRDVARLIGAQRTFLIWQVLTLGRQTSMSDVQSKTKDAMGAAAQARVDARAPSTTTARGIVAARLFLIGAPPALLARRPRYSCSRRKSSSAITARPLCRRCSDSCALSPSYRTPTSV